MDNKTFEKLSPKAQLAYTLGVASRIFGKDLVQQHYKKIKPLVRNLFGHGEPIDRKVPGDAQDPQNNYWRGQWQIYKAD